MLTDSLRKRPTLLTLWLPNGDDTASFHGEALPVVILHGMLCHYRRGYRPSCLFVPTNGPVPLRYKWVPLHRQYGVVSVVSNGMFCGSTGAHLHSIHSRETSHRCPEWYIHYVMPRQAIRLALGLALVDTSRIGASPSNRQCSVVHKFGLYHCVSPVGCVVSAMVKVLGLINW